MRLIWDSCKESRAPLCGPLPPVRRSTEANLSLMETHPKNKKKKINFLQGCCMFCFFCSLEWQPCELEEQEASFSTRSGLGANVLCVTDELGSISAACNLRVALIKRICSSAVQILSPPSLKGFFIVEHGFNRLLGDPLLQLLNKPYIYSG